VSLQIPAPELAYEYENGFYLSCAPGRIGKLLAHYELAASVRNVPGAYVECGVFKGASFARFAAFRHLFESEGTRRLVGFDTFGKFPETAFEADVEQRRRFVASAGDESISVDQLMDVLGRKNCQANVELVAGNILETVPDYVRRHPELRIALLHVDVDVFEPTDVVMRTLAPLVVPGGVIILDDYGIFPGATQAIDAYLRGRREHIRKFPFALAPAYIVAGSAAPVEDAARGRV
jgi:hypothetical protein